MSIFLTFKASQSCRKIFFNPLETCYFSGNRGLIKCQDVGVSLDLITTLSDCDSFDVRHALFSQGCCYLLCCIQCQLPTYDNSFRNIQSHVGICLTFGSLETVYLEDVFGLLPVVHFDNQVSVSNFLYVLGVVLDAISFSTGKGENLDRQTASKDSITMNLGKSATSWSEFHSDNF